MKVAFYRRGKANTELVNETDCIRPNLLITDMYKMYSVCARELLFFYEDENISEEALLSWAPSIMSHDKIGLEVTETIRKVLPEINRTRLLKHKTKEDLVLLGRFSALIKGMKKQFILNIDYRLRNSILKILLHSKKITFGN